MWVLRHRAELSRELGREIGPEMAISSLVETLTPGPIRFFVRVIDRLRTVLGLRKHSVVVE